MGFCNHLKDQDYYLDFNGTLYSADRSELSEELIKEASNFKNISLYIGTSVTNVDNNR